MNYIKKIISGICAGVIAVMGCANVFAFTPRTSLTAADCDSIYWRSSSEGNSFPRNWALAGGNCTWYAYGRAWELLGYRPRLSMNGAHKWYTYNDGYERGSEPRVGAVACWSDTDGTVGHVAIVEKINGDTITLSESGWSYTNSYFTVKNVNKYNMDYTLNGVTRHFQGYIYLPIGDVGNNNEAPQEEVIEEPKVATIPYVDIEKLREIKRAGITSYNDSGIQIYFNGGYLNLSNEAMLVGNTVVVPARDFLELFGGKVYWNAETKTFISEIGTALFTAKLGDKEMRIDNIPVKTEVPVMLNGNDKTMIPLRAACAMLGARIVSVDSEMNINIAY